MADGGRPRTHAARDGGIAPAGRVHADVEPPAASAPATPPVASPRVPAQRPARRLPGRATSGCASSARSRRVLDPIVAMPRQPAGALRPRHRAARRSLDAAGRLARARARRVGGRSSDRRDDAPPRRRARAPARHACAGSSSALRTAFPEPAAARRGRRRGDVTRSSRTRIRLGAARVRRLLRRSRSRRAAGGGGAGDRSAEAGHAPYRLRVKSPPKPKPPPPEAPTEIA